MTSVTVFDIKRFAVHDGPGIRTTVFLKGCPLDCWWCHNPESRSRKTQEVSYTRKLGEKVIESKKVYGKEKAIQQVIREILKDKLFFEESGGGVTFSGGEPLYQPEALFQLIKACSDHSLHTTVDTCGYAPWKVFGKILPYTDLFLYDLKLVDPERHHDFTGVKNDLIIGNLEKLLSKQANVELRIPLIPSVNNDEEELSRYLEFLEKLYGKIQKIHLLPYHEIADNKYKKLNIENRMKNLEPETNGNNKAFKSQLEYIGFEVSIGG